MNSEIVDSGRDLSSRNPAEFVVLGVLRLGPAHGYDICRHARKEVGFIWRLGTAQVYGLLNKLQREGLVFHERIDQLSKPAKKVFSLTPAGREVFDAWVSLPVHNMREMRLEFLTKLYFSGLMPGQENAKLLSAQLEVCREKMDWLATLKADCASGLERKAVEFRITMTKAVIHWLTGLLDMSESVSSNRKIEP